MKKFMLILAVTMLTTHLPADTVVLTISATGNGNLEIIASSKQAFGCVLQSTTDFVNWTAISTNTFPTSGMVTNILQATNSFTFYRAKALR